MLNKVPKKFIIQWFVLFITVAIFTTMLSSCGEVTISEIENDGSNRFKGLSGNVKIITDYTNGCRYIFIEDGFASESVASFSPLVKNKDEFDCDGEKFGN